jgi:hypothetical protein
MFEGLEDPARTPPATGDVFEVLEGPPRMPPVTGELFEVLEDPPRTPPASGDVFEGLEATSNAMVLLLAGDWKDVGADRRNSDSVEDLNGKSAG